ncbi:hypothetical protein CCHL11_10270 [Colletotrichum chlorophyti]|uniref:RING-type domain-containing protein n=1 Tax=Colletotrichum chlorophyti TaxID=708187 RepID=A0A1Q8R9B8_9PEZI|nr:hypothetical protein CCHL11_10270 [Colletotrichum chlorophyti]
MRAQATSSRNQCKILHCGHMMCEPCITRVAANRDGPVDNPNARSPQCPFCATRIGKYEHCGAQSCPNPGNVGYPMPKNMTEMAVFPRTTPEGGGLPFCCARCRMLRVERLSRKLIRVILNDDTAQAVWEPSADHRQHVGEYAVAMPVPELQKLMDGLRDTACNPEIMKKYAWVLPSSRDVMTVGKAEMPDRRRG